MPLRHIAYAPQKPYKEELQYLQQQDIITPLSINETDELCNSFILVPNPNGKVMFCLDPARLNQALIKPVHRGSTLSDVFPRLNYVQYLSLVDASSGNHNLKLDERSSYFTTFAYQFGRYRYKRLPFGAASAGEMFQRKIDKTFKDLHGVFGITDYIFGCRL